MYATADCEVDKKLKKRRMLNRAAAARCRQKKLDQIEDLKHELAYWKRANREKDLECIELRRQLAYSQELLKQKKDPNVVVLPELTLRHNQSPSSDLAVHSDDFLYRADTLQSDRIDSERVDSVSPISCIDMEDLNSLMSDVEELQFDDSWNVVFEKTTSTSFYDRPLGFPASIPQKSAILKPVNGFSSTQVLHESPSNKAIRSSTRSTCFGRPEAKPVTKKFLTQTFKFHEV